ncbi:MAG: AarF/UbiB family protein [Candidatus Firestonebacteria bacterium]
MQIIRLRKTYKNIKRMRQILNVLIKHGFGYLVSKLGLQPYISFGKRIVKFKHFEHIDEILSMSQRLRLVCEELGPTFIKFGQFLSSRADILPKEFVEELSKLQDNTTAFSFEEVEKLLNIEFLISYTEIFPYFEKEPTACASIAQVHYAKLKTGEDVMVKIQRPDIQKNITIDFEILKNLAVLLEKHIPESRTYNPTGIINEFLKIITKELDFSYEASNADKFRRNFKDSKLVIIPKVYFEHTTKRILTIEKITGYKISDVINSKDLKIDKKKIASNLVNVYIKMVFEDKFFHGDPHPGNIFVQKDGKIILVDFGIAGYINEEMMQHLLYLFINFLKRGLSPILIEYLKLGVSNENWKEYEKELIDLVERFHSFPIKSIKVSSVLDEIIQLVVKHKLKLPSDFVLLGKTFMIIENLARKLDPEFNFILVAEPYAKNLLLKRIQPQYLAKNLWVFFTDLYDLLKTFPQNIRNIFNKIQQGSLKLEFEHKGLENLILELDKASNRLSFSMIIASLIIGSSLVIQSGFGPKFYGFSALGIFGYFIAGILGLWLAIAILRSGRL